ncbi:MAG: UDP-N-acetylmuramoyl-L-alanyl-D-glutamate--2,6-diaminopimelate ligase, partial [Bacteroidaceae bacterium]|nr:UDP-N-acetylmuramoyl-L-alanyl-D-glutamate--2,6-diaminopimelate ligase [Bacteroidaceae bacterium]
MKLQQLIGDCKPQQVVGNVDRDVTGIEIDSRLIKEGAVFVAMRGTQVDGHSFIGKAIELGAA